MERGIQDDGLSMWKGVGRKQKEVQLANWTMLARQARVGSMLETLMWKPRRTNQANN